MLEVRSSAFSYADRFLWRRLRCPLFPADSGHQRSANLSLIWRVSLSFKEEIQRSFSVKAASRLARMQTYTHGTLIHTSKICLAIDTCVLYSGRGFQPDIRGQTNTWSPPLEHLYLHGSVWFWCRVSGARNSAQVRRLPLSTVRCMLCRALTR